MTLSDEIVWKVIDEFQKQGWLSEKAELSPVAEHICIRTIKPITKSIDKIIKENISKNIMKLILEEE